MKAEQIKRTSMYVLFAYKGNFTASISILGLIINVKYPYKIDVFLISAVAIFLYYFIKFPFLLCWDKTCLNINFKKYFLNQKMQSFAGYK